MINIFKRKKVIKTDTSLFKTDELGFNYPHYKKVVDYRRNNKLPLREDFKISYEHKSRDGGYRIDGTKIESKYHPLHDKLLINEKGDKYHIDIVSEHFHYGKYIYLMTRKVGTKSHGSLFWENISCQDKTILNSIEENKEKFKLVDK